MSDNPADLSISIGAKTDQASFKAAADAARQVGGAFAKTFEQVERSKALDAAAKDFARVAVAENDAAKATLNLIDNLKGLDATEKEIDKTVAAFEKQIAAIHRADAAAAEKAQNDARRAAEQSQLSAQDRFDETSRKVSLAGDAESAIRTIGGAAGFFGGTGIEKGLAGAGELFAVIEAAPRLRAALEGIPQTLTAAGEALGLLKTAQEAGTAVSAAATAAEGAQTAATGTLAAASGGATVSLGAMVVALGPIAAIGLAVAAAVAAVGVALNELNKQSQEAADGIRRRYDAEKEVAELARSGASSADAIKERINLESQLKDSLEAANRAEAERDATYANDVAVNGKIAADLRLNNAVYKEFDEIIKENKTSAKEAEAGIKALNKALDEGDFAAADAAAKAEESSKAQEKAADDAARAQEKAAQDAERAQAKREADAKAAADKAAREAEAQAQKIQQTQDNIAKATENFANKQADIAVQASQKAADLRQSAQDKAFDADLKYYRDTVKLATDARNAEAEAQRKFNQAAAQDAINANRKFEDLRDQAIEDESSALEDRNFLQAAKVREGLDKANKQAIKEYERAADDRAAAARNEAQERYIDLQEARKQRSDALKQEREDNQTAYKRAQRDAAIAQERSLLQARTAYERELATQQAFLQQMGANNAAFYAQQTSMAQSAANGGSTQAGAASGAAAGRATVPLGGGAGGSFPTGSFGGLRPIHTAAGNHSIVNNVTIQANTSNDVYDAVSRLGLINA